MVKVSGKALAAGNIEANVSGAIPAASALPLTIVVSLPSQVEAPPETYAKRLPRQRFLRRQDRSPIQIFLNERPARIKHTSLQFNIIRMIFQRISLR